MGTKLKFSTTFHPQIDGQSEWRIQILEDILRSCIMELKENQDEHLPLTKFAYNNSYQSSIDMAPSEALYGRKCRTLVCQDDTDERKLLGPKIILITTNKVKLIREKIKTP